MSKNNVFHTNRASSHTIVCLCMCGIRHTPIVLGFESTQIASASAVLTVSNIKRSRYCLQVSNCAIYSKLKEAHRGSNSVLPVLMWLDHAKSCKCLRFFFAAVRKFFLICQKHFCGCEEMSKKCVLNFMRQGGQLWIFPS